MDTGKRGAFLIAIVGAIAILAGLLFLVGGRRVLDTLTSADPSFVAATVGLALCWLTAWSLMLRTVLGTLRVAMPAGKSFFVYSGAVFANNVTPFGQAGGEPITGLLISKVSDARYEAGLVGIASVDVLNVVSSVSLVLIGISYYAANFALGDRLVTAVASAFSLIAVIVIAMLAAWRYRYPLVDRIAGTIASVLTRLRPKRFDVASVEAIIEERMDRFFDHIERMATNRRGLAVVFGLSLLGWLFQAVALLAAFAALGYSVPLSVALFVIPLGNVAGATPLPGGLGGIEAAFVALLVPTTGIPAAVVTAAVLIHRGAIYWMPVVIGGGSMAAFGVRTVS